MEVKSVESPWEEEESAPFSTPEQVDILIVDDLPEKLLVYRTILEELGQNLVSARSGEEALKLVLKHEFAVILLDVNMPGMDGFETAFLIRKRKRSARTPIIFLTAFTDEISTAQGYASGAVDYLPTPVVPEVLRAKVRVFIELSQMRRQAALQAEERALRTAAEESARRWEFLVEVSEILARAHNQKEILEALVRITVPYLADVSMLSFTDMETGDSWTKWACSDKDGTVRSQALASLTPVPGLQKAIDRVLTTGKRQHVSGLSLSKPGMEEAEAESAPGSALILPLTVEGQMCGVLVLGRKHPDRIYPSFAVSLASEMARRTGLALENIRLVEKIREADRRKDEFLGMLAHELRNPLGPISNAVHLLQMIGPKESRLEQLRDIMERQVTHMARMIDDLLDATRLARGKILLRKERCDLGRIIRQTAEDYRSVFDASGLELQMHVPDFPVWVEGDSTRLVQVIGNLLHNAHKFTNPGGTVTVRLQWEEGASASVITVTDTGIGIEPRMLPCVFDVFRQAEQGLDRARGGLGLGLALVKGLVELHCGTVTAVSEGLGKGAEFRIQLPVSVCGAEDIPGVPVIPIPDGEKYRILVIEDNRDTAESARLLLSLEGYDVRTAHNGRIGLEVARDFTPQIVLCDIGLPGMDGYEVARTIRRDVSLSSAYVIALTGYGRDEDQRQAQEAGFDLHLTKPIDYSNLRRVLACLPARA